MQIDDASNIDDDKTFKTLGLEFFFFQMAFFPYQMSFFPYQMYTVPFHNWNDYSIDS
jgi:hypothetical protein